MPPVDLAQEPMERKSLQRGVNHVSLATSSVTIIAKHEGNIFANMCRPLT
jgi:hypothetical protein